MAGDVALPAHLRAPLDVGEPEQLRDATDLGGAPRTWLWPWVSTLPRSWLCTSLVPWLALWPVPWLAMSARPCTWPVTCAWGWPSAQVRTWPSTWLVTWLSVVLQPRQGCRADGGIVRRRRARPHAKLGHRRVDDAELARRFVAALHEQPAVELELPHVVAVRLGR